MQKYLIVNRLSIKSILIFIAGALLAGFFTSVVPLDAQQLKPTKHMPLIESPAMGDMNYFVIFLTGNGGWRNLAQAVTAYLNSKNVSVLAINTKKYLWKEKQPAQIACDLESIIDLYREKWKKTGVVLLGYSMGAEDLPFAVNRMNDNYLPALEDIILIGPWQLATFKINILDYFMELNRGTDIYAELQKMKVKKAYVICDDNSMSICHKDLDCVIDHSYLGGGHHFGGDYDTLANMIGKRLNLE